MFRLKRRIHSGIKVARRVIFYIIAKRRRFTFNKRSYHYFYHPYGRTWYNERAIEVPIIWEEVKKHDAQKVLEVGNVLSHYYPVYHDIVDKYEQAPGVINEDIRDFRTSKSYDLITSISTIEHVAYDELMLDAQERTKSQSLEDPLRVAIKNLKSHLSEGGEIIITVPLRQNPALDRLLNQEKIFTNIKYLKRISKSNMWKEARDTEIRDAKYDWPFPNANVLAVCIFRSS